MGYMYKRLPRRHSRSVNSVPHTFPFSSRSYTRSPLSLASVSTARDTISALSWPRRLHRSLIPTPSCTADAIWVPWAVKIDLRRRDHHLMQPTKPLVDDLVLPHRTNPVASSAIAKGHRRADH